MGEFHPVSGTMNLMEEDPTICHGTYARNVFRSNVYGMLMVEFTGQPLEKELTNVFFLAK